MVKKEGDGINSNIFGAVLAFCVGVLIASVGYFLLKLVLKKYPKSYIAAQFFKQLIQIGYLFALFFFGDKTPWSAMWLLVGGCLGITLPMIFFTSSLLKVNKSSNEKEGSRNG